MEDVTCSVPAAAGTARRKDAEMRAMWLKPWSRAKRSMQRARSAVGGPPCCSSLLHGPDVHAVDTNCSTREEARRTLRSSAR